MCYDDYTDYEIYGDDSHMEMYNVGKEEVMYFVPLYVIVFKRLKRFFSYN